MLTKPMVMDGNLARPIGPGDVLAAGELLQSLTTAGTGAITAQLLAGGLINRTGPGAGYADTPPTSAALIAWLVGNGYVAPNVDGSLGVPVGLTWRVKFINTVAFALTMGAAVGATLVLPNVAASSVKEYLITITNGTPQQVFAATTVNTSAVISGLTTQQLSKLSVGMLVSGTGISGGTTIAGINAAAGTLTLSAAATADGTLIPLTFNPTYTIQGLGQGLL